MLIRRPTDIRPSEITPESIYLNRRTLMVGAGSILAASSLGAGSALANVDPVDLPNVAKSTYTLEEKTNSFKEITTYNNFYEYGTDKSDPSDNAPDLLKKAARSKAIHKAESIQVFALDGAFLDSLDATTDRNAKWTLVHSEGVLYVTCGETNITTPVTSCTLSE